MADLPYVASVERIRQLRSRERVALNVISQHVRPGSITVIAAQFKK